ncbi:MAG: hypothetical protein WAM30_04275 [Candidatus Dormiibacterota bacterium]
METLPREQVVELCGSLDEFELFLLVQDEVHAAGEALGVDDPDSRLLEPQARRLDLLMGITDDPEDQEDLREMARNLRRAPEYVAEMKAEYERTKTPEVILQAMAIAGSCWSDEPVEARLRRIEDALQQLSALYESVDEQEVERRGAIGEQIASVYRLREGLVMTRDDGD